MRDDRFRPDPVGAKRQADPADVDDIGKVADIQFYRADAAWRRPCLLDPFDDLVQAGLLGCGVDPGGLVEAVLGLHSAAPAALLVCAIRRGARPGVN